MRTALAVLLLLTSVSAASARTCGNTGAGFNKWMKEFRQEMAAKGISKRTLNSSLNRVTYSTKVIKIDRNRRTSKESFKKIYNRRTYGMVSSARKKMKKHAKLFSRIERRYGVPKAILTTIWGLETAFGRFMPKFPIMRSLATLSYDCRRSDFFTAELIAALKIVERFGLSPHKMLGAWSGEIGQIQFLPTRYMDYAVNFDDDHELDLIRSGPDALASTAAWFQGNGWQRGEGWDEGTPNYEVIKKWNRATVYQKIITKAANELSKY